MTDAAKLLASAVELQASLVGLDGSKDFNRKLDEAEARQDLASALIVLGQLSAARKQLDLSIDRLSGIGDNTTYDRRRMELLGSGYEGLGELHDGGLYEPVAARSAFAKSKSYADEIGRTIFAIAKARMMQIAVLNHSATHEPSGSGRGSEKLRPRPAHAPRTHRLGPAKPAWQRDWAVNLTVVADFSDGQEGADKAKGNQDYESAIQKLEALVKRDPANMDWVLDLANAHDAYGRYLSEHAGDLHAALKQFDAAMPIFERIMEIDSMNLDARLSRDWELIERAEYEGQLGSGRDVQTRLLRKATDSVLEARHVAKESVRATDTLFYAQRVSCMLIPPEQRPRAPVCLAFLRYGQRAGRWPGT